MPKINELLDLGVRIDGSKHMLLKHLTSSDITLKMLLEIPYITFFSKVSIATQSFDANKNIRFALLCSRCCISRIKNQETYILVSNELGPLLIDTLMHKDNSVAAYNIAIIVLKYLDVRHNPEQFILSALLEAEIGGDYV